MIETQLRSGLHALAEEIRPDRPPIGEPGHKRARQRRWRVVAVAGVLVAGGAAAQATGLLPDPVTRVFERITGWGHAPDVRVDSAHIVATASGSGTTYELWVAEGDHGGICQYLRFVRPGSPENGPRGCVNDPRGMFGGDLYSSIDSGYGDDLLFSGHAPVGASSVEATLRTGHRITAPVGHEGFFLSVATIPGGDSSMASIRALNADGTEAASRSYTQPTDPSPTGESSP